jgi:hypothetical protein
LIADGIDVYFLDNRSTDATVSVVRQLEGQGVVGIETFPPEVAAAGTNHFPWERILERKEELARSLQADWFVHQDADEFRESPWSGQTLLDGIRRVDAAGYNAIDFEVLNFRPTTADPTDATSVRERLQFYERAEPFDRIQVNCWKKTSEPLGLAASGGHEVAFPSRRVFPVRFLLRHYPIRSQEHGERKVFRERLPRFDAAELARGWHIQYASIAESSTFVRNPASLKRYDPDDVRTHLVAHSRDAEQLETLLATARASEEEVERLRIALAGREEQLEALVATARAFEEEVERLRIAVAGREEQLAALEGVRDQLLATEARLDATEVHLNLVLATRSWRLTSPLRAARQVLRWKE